MNLTTICLNGGGVWIVILVETYCKYIPTIKHGPLVAFIKVGQDTVLH